MKCRACDKELTSSELRVLHPVTRQPEDFCKICRAIGQHPDDSERHTETLTATIYDLDEYGCRYE